MVEFLRLETLTASQGKYGRIFYPIVRYGGSDRMLLRCFPRGRDLGAELYAKKVCARWGRWRAIAEQRASKFNR